MSLERLCKGGELLDKILSKGGRYTEEDAKVIVVQILGVIAYCHLQDVVHCDLKPENFLFATREEDDSVRVIDFGLSDFIRPGQAILLQSYINQVCARRWVVLCNLPLLEANEEKATESTNNLPRL